MMNIRERFRTTLSTGTQGEPVAGWGDKNFLYPVPIWYDHSFSKSHMCYRTRLHFIRFDRTYWYMTSINMYYYLAFESMVSIMDCDPSHSPPRDQVSMINEQKYHFI